MVSWNVLSRWAQLIYIVFGRIRTIVYRLWKMRDFSLCSLCTAVSCAWLFRFSSFAGRSSLSYGFIPLSYQANLGIDVTFVSVHRSTFFKSVNVLVDFETSSLARLLRDLVEARFTLDAFVQLVRVAAHFLFKAQIVWVEKSNIVLLNQLCFSPLYFTRAVSWPYCEESTQNFRLVISV